MSGLGRRSSRGRPGGVAPLTSAAPRRSTRVLRTAELNVVGKAALLGSCLLAGALGYLAGRSVGLPIVLTSTAGALVPAAAVGLLDRHRWRQMFVSSGWGGTPEDVAAVVAALALRGVTATAEIQPRTANVSLRYQHADERTVNEVLTEVRGKRRRA